MRIGSALWGDGDALQPREQLLFERRRLPLRAALIAVPLLAAPFLGPSFFPTAAVLGAVIAVSSGGMWLLLRYRPGVLLRFPLAARLVDILTIHLALSLCHSYFSLPALEVTYVLPIVAAAAAHGTRGVTVSVLAAIAAIVLGRGESIGLASLLSGEQMPTILLDATIFTFVGSYITFLLRTSAESARARLAAIVEATPDCISIFDAQGRCTYLNPAGRAMLDIPASEDIGGMSVLDTVPASVRQQLLEEAVPFALREGAWSGQTALVSRGGREIAVSLVLLARSNQKALEYFATISRDITEHMRLLEKQEEQARLEGALLVSRTVAHEINNELGKIVGFGDLLALHPAIVRDAVLAEYARVIGEAGTHAAEQVSRLQRLIRLEETPSPLGPDRPVLDLQRSTGTLAGSAPAATGTPVPAGN